jgi:hypothetical protein
MSYFHTSRSSAVRVGVFRNCFLVEARVRSFGVVMGDITFFVLAGTDLVEEVEWM